MEINDKDVSNGVAKEEREEENPNGSLTKGIVLLTFFSALGGFLFGYDTGVVSGAMLLIKKEFELSTFWQELIVSATVVAAWLSALLGGPAADFFGRRKVILFSSFVFVSGSVIMSVAPDKEVLLLGRIVVGLGIGFSSMCVPIYISEVAPLSSRGRLTVINTIFLTGGQFVASVICGLFSVVSEGWRWMLGLAAIPAFIQLVAFIFAPDSPRWLSLHGKLEEAKKVLEKFRPQNSGIENEIESLRRDPTQVANLSTILSSPTVRRALVLGCLLQLFQQISGINTVMYYSASIIAMAGVNDDQTAIWLAAVTSFFNFTFTFVGLWLVERIGRRPLTLGSILGVSFALLSLGVSFQLSFITSPDITNPVSGTACSKYQMCSYCSHDPECGFCFLGELDNVHNATCLVANHTQYNEVSTNGTCANPEKFDAVFAYNWCPSKYAWLSIVGLCLYLCFFAPGMGPMPWCINSEIYPNWARARCTSIATSINWGANLFVSLTFLSLTEILTKHGAFYLYMSFALSGFFTFFFILPETKGVKLEEVESIFEKPLCSLKPWKKKKNKDELISSLREEESYGTL